MSALELTDFVMGHMPFIIPLLSGYPRIQAEFRQMMLFMAVPAAGLPMKVKEVLNLTPYEQDEVYWRGHWPRRGETSVASLSAVAQLYPNDRTVVTDGIGYEGYVWRDGVGQVARFKVDRDSEVWVERERKRKWAVDRLVPWIRAVTLDGPDDVIHLSLYDQTEQPAGPTYFGAAKCL